MRYSLLDSFFCTTFCTAKVLVRFGWICVVGGGSSEGAGASTQFFYRYKYLLRHARDQISKEVMLRVVIKTPEALVTQES
jgi:hypothetical protein